MDVNLAAFLFCWICVFVFLTGDPEFVCPETFKITSIMTTGRKIINLAFLVLAHIYHELNTIATSTYAGSSHACFPMYYLYGWLSHYFDIYFLMSNEITRPWMVKFLREGRPKPYNEYSTRTLIHTKIS